MIMGDNRKNTFTIFGDNQWNSTFMCDTICVPFCFCKPKKILMRQSDLGTHSSLHLTAEIVQIIWRYLRAFL